MPHLYGFNVLINAIAMNDSQFLKITATYNQQISCQTAGDNIDIKRNLLYIECCFKTLFRNNFFSAGY